MKHLLQASEQHLALALAAAAQAAGAAPGGACLGGKPRRPPWLRSALGVFHDPLEQAGELLLLATGQAAEDLLVAPRDQAHDA